MMNRFMTFSVSGIDVSVLHGNDNVARHDDRVCVPAGIPVHICIYIPLVGKVRHVGDVLTTVPLCVGACGQRV